MSACEFYRGDIWLIDWNPSRGSEQKGIRPSLIIQTDKGNLNPNYKNTIVLTVSSKSKELSFHHKLIPDNNNNLNQISYVKCEQILTISKTRLIKKIGKVNENELNEIIKKVNLVIN